MDRMRLVRRQEECPGSPQEVEELFATLFPQGGERVLRAGQMGWGLLAAQGPQMALTVVRLTRSIAAGAFLSARPDLREMAVQTVNLHFRCEFSYRSHLAYLPKVGLSLEAISALPYWRTSSLFNVEQKLVIEYTLAVLAGEVPDRVHRKVSRAFGRAAVAELAVAVGHWSFWAMLLNAAQLNIDAK